MSCTGEAYDIHAKGERVKEARESKTEEMFRSPDFGFKANSFDKNISFRQNSGKNEQIFQFLNYFSLLTSTQFGTDDAVCYS